jgi:hypothetical protein
VPAAADAPLAMPGLGLIGNKANSELFIHLHALAALTFGLRSDAGRQKRAQRCHRSGCLESGGGCSKHRHLHQGVSGSTHSNPVAW